MLNSIVSPFPSTARRRSILSCVTIVPMRVSILCEWNQCASRGRQFFQRRLFVAQENSSRASTACREKNLRAHQRDGPRLSYFRMPSQALSPPTLAPDDKIVTLNHVRKFGTIENRLTGWRGKNSEIGPLGWRANLSLIASCDREHGCQDDNALDYSTARQIITEATTPVASASSPAGIACRVCLIPIEPK